MNTIDATGDVNDSWVKNLQPYEGCFQVFDESLFDHMVDSVELDGKTYEVYFVTRDRQEAEILASNKFSVYGEMSDGMWYLIALEPIKNQPEMEQSIANQINKLITTIKNL